MQAEGLSRWGKLRRCSWLIDEMVGSRRIMYAQAFANVVTDPIHIAGPGSVWGNLSLPGNIYNSSKR